MKYKTYLFDAEPQFYSPIFYDAERHSFKPLMARDGVSTGLPLRDLNRIKTLRARHLRRKADERKVVNVMFGHKTEEDRSSELDDLEASVDARRSDLEGVEQGLSDLADRIERDIEAADIEHKRRKEQFKLELKSLRNRVKECMRHCR